MRIPSVDGIRDGDEHRTDEKSVVYPGVFGTLAKNTFGPKTPQRTESE